MLAQWPQQCFVTGTDTGVGKTHVTVHLLRYFAAQGLRVVGMKPVASGCAWINGEWQNEDVAKLLAASSVQAPRALVNPYCFDPAIAPHIAAEQAGVEIQISQIAEAYATLTTMADIVIVEGAGGLFVPLNAQQTMADLILALQLPALLVVGMQLGCINHALLSVQGMQQKKIPLVAWVANHVDANMQVQTENVHTLTHWLKQAPCIELPYQP